MDDQRLHIVKTVVVAIFPTLGEEAAFAPVVNVVAAYANGQANKAYARSNLRTALHKSDIVAHDKILDLCNTTAVNLVTGYGNWSSEQNDSDGLDIYPAREFFQCYEREAENVNWVERWKQAGGSVFAEKRMIALATDSIWSRISFLGLPFPPFDLDSGMDLNVVGRNEAQELGLLTQNEQLVPMATDLDFEQALKERFSFLYPRS